jgi:tRNA(Ile)-lysidine synthase
MHALPITAQEAQELLAPLARFSRLALAVSGGPDSVALMHLAARWRAGLARGPRLSVLTVDHGIRPESRAEAEFVARLAAELGLPHVVLTWEAQDAKAGRLQERARTARYDLMADYCHANDIPALVTAHTLDDQAETFLMRLKRGSGLDGLAAIPEQGEWSGIAVLRPLLDTPKARLVATLVAGGVEYVSDPSNLDRRFERARMRASADTLAALGLTSEAIALSARRLRRAREALDSAAGDFLDAHSETSDAGYALVDPQALASAPAEIALRALGQLIGLVGGGETPLQLAKLEALLDALRAHPGKTHTLGRCRIGAVKGRLGIFREVRGEGLPVALIRPGEKTLWDNRFRIELGAGEAEPIMVRALGESGMRALRERADLPPWLPPLAGRALPACWRGEDLLGLPLLSRSDPVKTSGFGCRAIFVGAAKHANEGTGSRSRR